MKFICQPDQLKYNDALNEFKHRSQLSKLHKHQNKLSQKDLNDLWTEDDEKKRQKSVEDAKKGS